MLRNMWVAIILSENNAEQDKIEHVFFSIKGNLLKLGLWLLRMASSDEDVTVCMSSHVSVAVIHLEKEINMADFIFE